MSKILDNYGRNGKDYEDFKTESAGMAEITKDLVAKGIDITFLSYCDIPSAQEEGKVSFYVLTRDYIQAFLAGERLKIGRISLSEIGEDLLDELKATTGLMCIIRDEKYIVSDIAIPTLGIRASVNGDMTTGRQNLIRNMHFADAVFAKNEKIHFVYREEQIGTKADDSPIMARKIFAALGGAFSPVPQTIIADMADMIGDESIMGRMDVREWCVDHLFTDLYVEFPEAAEEFKTAYGVTDNIIPGIFLCTSDIGKSSIIARGTYRIEGYSKSVVTDEVMIKHVGNLKAREICDRINGEILANVRVLPEALCSLISKEVADYSKLDLTTESGQRTNLKAMQDAIENTAKKCLSDLPAKRRKELTDRMMDEIDPSRPYTLYDVAVDFMGVPDRIEGLDRPTVEKIVKSCAKAPFVLADKKSGSSDKESDIYLLPA